MSKRLGGIIGCKYKPLHGIQTGSPMVVKLGQQYNTGEKHTAVVMLLVIGKEKTFKLYNESTEIFYDVSETVVS